MLPWPPVRAQPDTIPAPPFPRGLTWINVAPLRMDKQLGRPVLIEFWDFCRVNSLRTLPYLKAWHERYAERGLRVIGIHAGGFELSRDEANVRRAVERLGVPYPVVIDAQLELWDFYGNEGWPARYLWDTRGALFSLHYGEGAYEETEREIQELLGVERGAAAAAAARGRAGRAAARADRGPAGRLQRARTRPAACGRCSRARARSTVNGRAIAVSEPGCFPLVEHPHHTAGVLELRGRPGRDLPRHVLHAGGRSSA